MTKKYKDLSGQKFNKLTAISYFGPNKRGDAAWVFRCDCGRVVNIKGSSVSTGRTKSCGCLKVETARSTAIVNKTTHGDYGSRTYSSWSNMMSRCKDVDNRRYGGRGITVCDEWHRYENFVADMGYRPEGVSLDRIDNNKGYTLENCQWATRKQQAINRVTTKFADIDGVVKCVSEWADTYGIDKRTICRRVNIYGWDMRKAIVTPVRGKK